MLPSAYLAQKLTRYLLPTKDRGVLRTVGDIMELLRVIDAW
jgi:hypothetical protein